MGARTALADNAVVVAGVGSFTLQWLGAPVRRGDCGWRTDPPIPRSTECLNHSQDLPVASAPPRRLAAIGTPVPGRGTGSARKLAAALVVGMFASTAGLGALGAGTADAASVGGVTAGATVTFHCSTHSVSGTAHTNSGLSGSGVWALVWVYDYSTGRWANAGAWVPADGIHQFVVPASNPYLSAYVQFARNVNGWVYASEWVAMSEEDIRGGAFCR